MLRRELVLLSFLAACRFDLNAVTRPASAERLVQVIDAGGEARRDSRPDLPADARAADTRPSDTRPSDARPPDTRAPDTRPPDLPQPDKASLKKSCWDLYHMAQGYELCEEKQKSCRFYVYTGGSSCASVCVAYGGACLGAQNNGNAKCTAAPPPIGCDSNLQDQICECSKP